jgi:F-type H+-transporting ATPase subunit b
MRRTPLLTGILVAIALCAPSWAAEGVSALEALKQVAQKLEKDGDAKGALATYHHALDIAKGLLKEGSETRKEVDALLAKADGTLETDRTASLGFYAQALDIAIRETGHKASFTDVSVPTLVWAWVSFLVTLFALKKVAWPMLAAKMEEREVRIAEGLKKAEEAEKRAQELMTKQEQILEEARKEAQKFIADSRVAAQNAKNDALTAAQKEIAAERERAKKEIGLERAHAVEELKRAAVELTLEASARLLKREMRDEDHRRLAREVIDEVVAKR